MPSPLFFDLNGVQIHPRADGYFNATAMCRANGTRWQDYARLGSTTAFLAALSDVTQIHVKALVISRPGPLDRGGGTWVHPRVAIRRARWLSPKYARPSSAVGRRPARHRARRYPTARTDPDPSDHRPEGHHRRGAPAGLDPTGRLAEWSPPSTN